ncbi:SET domain-containing protein [Hymenopellis radicata]|nr:SET domain-containing protein [Hymenopellis radicata]
MAATSPPEADLRSALIALKTEHPALGIQKIHAQLLVSHPEWTVSEKRTRKILQNEGLTGTVTIPADASLVPSSRLMPESAIAIMPPSISVRQLGPLRGKGLVAKTPITAGDVLWKEDPWILAPEWNVYDLQQQGGACAHCSTPLRRTGIPCEECGLQFCNRLCLNRARDAGHRILCTQSGRKLLALAREMGWLALHALARATARVLQTRETDVYEAFAVLGLEERFRFQGADVGELRSMWVRSFEVYKAAFAGKDLGDMGTLEGFLKGLGRMSLNLEAHGGLYTLHSHLNHSCEPNISVRHLHQREALARISVIALRDISPGEELTITYVNPELTYGERKRALGEWGFVCRCSRCVQDERKGVTDVSDLEAELKEGLGVL